MKKKKKNPSVARDIDKANLASSLKDEADDTYNT